jgi:hypothetical protein
MELMFYSIMERRKEMCFYVLHYNEIDSLLMFLGLEGEIGGWALC